MDLTTEQIAAFREHLITRGAPAWCAMCGADQWRITTTRDVLTRVCQFCGVLQCFEASRCFAVAPWEQLVQRIADDLAARDLSRLGPTALYDPAALAVSFKGDFDAYRAWIDGHDERVQRMREAAHSLGLGG